MREDEEARLVISFHIIRRSSKGAKWTHADQQQGSGLRVESRTTTKTSARHELSFIQPHRQACPVSVYSATQRNTVADPRKPTRVGQR